MNEPSGDREGRQDEALVGMIKAALLRARGGRSRSEIVAEVKKEVSESQIKRYEAGDFRLTPKPPGKLRTLLDHYGLPAGLLDGTVADETVPPLDDDVFIAISEAVHESVRLTVDQKRKALTYIGRLPRPGDDR